jgi:hypothetical protein
MRGVIYQCKTCGARVRARKRRAHLGDVHHDGAYTFDPKRVNAGFTRTIDPHDPSRADKWVYADEEIRVVIPGLQPKPEESATPEEEDHSMIPKYPDIVVQLAGEDGNSFHLLGKVNRALRQAGVSQAERDAFRQEATQGNYDQLLQTIMRWVDVT